MRKVTTVKMGLLQPGATALCREQATRALLEHAGPRGTPEGTETQGTPPLACPDSFQQDGQEIREDEGS